jgi:hypothetical protein
MADSSRLKHPVYAFRGGPMSRSLDGRFFECKWVKDDKTTDCCWKISTDKDKRSTTNMEGHLEAVHKKDSPKSFADWKKKLDAYKKGGGGKAEASQGFASGATGGQSSLEAFVTPTDSAPKYKHSAKDHGRQKLIDHALVMWVAASAHSPYRVVADPMFAEFIRRLDPRYELPGRFTVARNVLELADEVRKLIFRKLQKAQYVTAGLDLWTRATGEPYMGIHVTFYDEEDERIRNFVIAVLAFPHPHTAPRIADLFCTFWTETCGLNWDQLFRIVSDNASNMVAAFKRDFARIAFEETKAAALLREAARSDRESPEEVANEDEQMEIQQACELGGPVTPVMDGEAPSARTIQAGISRLAEQMTNASIEEEDADEELSVTEFDLREEELKEHYRKLRLGCFVHSLALSLLKGKEEATVKPLISDLSEFVSKIRGKKAGEMLKEVSGITLRCYNKTRWSSELFMIQKLLAAKEFLPGILDKCKVRNLDPDIWELMADLERFLLPFGDFVVKMQSEDKPMLSSCIPFLNCLLRHLAGFKPNCTDKKCRKVVVCMRDSVQADMKKRFAHILDKDSDSFMPIYAVGTFLDPRYLVALPGELADEAKDYLRKKLTPDDEEAEEQTNEPQAKAAKTAGDSLLMSLMGSPAKQGSTSAAAFSSSSADYEEKLERQLEAYERSKPRLNLDDCPLKFWNQVAQHNRFPKVAAHANHILATAPTSSSVERLFSSCGKVIGKDRRCLSAKALEAEALVCCNRKFILEQKKTK